MNLPTTTKGSLFPLKPVKDLLGSIIKPAVWLALFFYAQVSFSQCLSSFERILPDSTLATFERYGYSVAIHENFLAVGAYSDDSLAHNGGIVYLYERTGSTIRRIAIIHPPDLQGNSQFGYSLDLSENTLVVSSKGYDFPNEQDRVEPKVYIFEKSISGWEGELTISVLKATEYQRNFGETVKISPDEKSIFVTLPYGVDGSVYSFRKPVSGWGSQVPFQEIKASPAYLDEHLTTDFGEEIALWGKYLIVGGDMTYHNDRYGGIHVFKDVGEGQPNYQPIALLQGKNKQSTFFPGLHLAIDDRYIYSSILENNKRFFIAYPRNAEWQDEYPSILIPFTKDTLGVYVKSIEVIGDEVFVMAPAAGNQETVFVFHRDSLESPSYVPRRHTLQEGGEDSGFAVDTDSDGPFLMVGNHLDPKLNGGRGSFQLYERSLDTDTIKLLANVTERSYNATDHLFGQKLLLFQEHLLVGAPENSSSGKRQGAVHIYQEQNQRFVKKGSVVPEGNYSSDDSFGFDLAGDAANLAVGAPAFKANGGVFIYKANSLNGLTLELDTILLPPDSLRITLFGAAIQLEGKLLAIASMDQTGKAASRLFIYEKNENGFWQFQDTYSSYGSPLSKRGVYSVDIQDGRILIGNGAVLNGNGELLAKDPSDQKWKSIATFPPPFTPSVGFGTAVHLGKEHVYISFPTKDVGGKENVGAIFVYPKSKTGWQAAQKGIQIVPPDTVENGQFGTSFQEKENTLIIGAPGSSLAMENNQLSIRKKPGAAYIISAKDYNWEQFSLVEKLEGKQKQSFDGYGYSVTLNEDHFIIGAPWESSERGFNSGAVYITQMPPVAKVVSPVCEDASPVHLFAFPEGGEWEGPGISDPFAGIFDPAIAGVGSHELRYRLPDCSLESTIVIKVNDKPTITSSAASQVYKCKNETVTLGISAENGQKYNWYFKEDEGGSFTALQGEVTDTIEVAKTGFYFCEVLGASCSVNSDTINVVEESIAVKISGLNPQYICSEEPVRLSINAATGNGFSWYFSASINTPFTKLASETQKTLLAKEAGFYFSKVRGESCWFYSDTVEIISSENRIKIESVPLLCNQEKVFLKASPEGGKWFGNGITDPEKGVFDPSGLANGDYRIEYLLQQNACAYQSTITITVDITASPLLHYESTEICLPQNPVLEVENHQDFTQLEWYRLENNQASLIDNSQPIYQLAEPGIYFVKAYKNSCSINSDTVGLTVLDFSFKAPNVFTPNQDSFNQAFEIEAENMADFQLQIFSRWGKPVYSSSSIEEAWEAEGISTGIYYWIINFRDCWNKSRQMKGYVQVIR